MRDTHIQSKLRLYRASMRASPPRQPGGCRLTQRTSESARDATPTTDELTGGACAAGRSTHGRDHLDVVVRGEAMHRAG